MKDPFVKRTQESQNKRGKKILGEMVEKRSQNVSEDKRTTLQVEVNLSSAHDEDLAERGTKGNGTRRPASECTPVEQEQDFATSTRTLDRGKMSQLFIFSN